MNKLKITCYFLILGSLSGFSQSVLVFSKTQGYRHGSIETGIEAIKKLGHENNFKVDATEDATYFTKKNLKKYDAIIFLSTTMNVFNEAQEKTFQRYIRSGGGFVGVHAASDTEYEWPWYGKMLGAYFESHPHQQEATLKVVDRSHTSTKHLSDEWIRFDEWYNFKSINPDINVLINIDENSYEGGKNGIKHPMAWYHTFEGGRVFYTGLGHTKKSYSESYFLQHLLGGIYYAAGIEN